MAAVGGLAVAVVIAAVSRAPAERVTAVPTTVPRMAAPTVVLCPTAFNRRYDRPAVRTSRAGRAVCQPWETVSP
ncbi:hypothetical protein GCM10017687_87020 [Streptomyces echinatus]